MLAPSSCVPSEFIHCRGMVHGDIKPENLLVTAPGEAEGPR